MENLNSEKPETIEGYERVCIFADKKCSGARDPKNFYNKCVHNPDTYLRCDDLRSEI